jgi:hypothetical protein
MPRRSLYFGADIICKTRWKGQDYYIITASDKEADNLPINFIVPRRVLVKAFGKDEVKRFDALDDFVNFHLSAHYFQRLYTACCVASLRMPNRTTGNNGYIELNREDFHEDKG